MSVSVSHYIGSILNSRQIPNSRFIKTNEETIRFKETLGSQQFTRGSCFTFLWPERRRFFNKSASRSNLLLHVAKQVRTQVELAPPWAVCLEPGCTLRRRSLCPPQPGATYVSVGFSLHRSQHMTPFLNSLT